MTTLLVTGGLGFVMSHVVRQWLDSNSESSTIILDPSDMDSHASRWLDGYGTRLVHVRAATTDSAALNTLSDGITHVVHGAAVTSMNRLADGGRGLAGMVPAISTNIEGTTNLLAWAVGRGDVRRFVNVSSGSVYANDGPIVIDEDGPVDPDGYYGISKRAGEMLTGQSAKQFGLPALSVRLSGVYGPMDRETPHRAVRCAPMRILEAARDGREIPVHAPDAVGDFIHAGCVARAILSLLECNAPRHGVYNIAYGEAVSLRYLLDLTGQLVPEFRWRETDRKDADLVGDPSLSTARWGAYDISRIRSETGWAPLPLDEAIEDYWRWLRQ